MWPSSDRWRRQPSATSNPAGRAPLTSSSKEPTGMARSHGRPNWTREGVGGKCTRRRRGDVDAARTWEEFLFPALGHCVTRSDMAQHHGGQWAWTHLQMKSNLLVWAEFQEREKGEKPGGDLDALILHARQRLFLLESRLSREGKGILGCEYCVLVASNANIDKGNLVLTKEATRPTTDEERFSQCCKLQLTFHASEK